MQRTSTLWIGNHLIAAEHGTRSRADVLRRTLRWLGRQRRHGGWGSAAERPWAATTISS
jgi:hypothetical protein